jgi:hypothetical protein
VVDDGTSATPRYAVASSRMKLWLTARSAQEYGDLMTLDPAARRQRHTAHGAAEHMGAAVCNATRSKVEKIDLALIGNEWG